MNHQDVLNAVVKLTNVDSDTCEKIINAFESNASVKSVISGFFGGSMNTESVAAKVASETGINADICAKVIDALTSVVGKGIKDKTAF